MKMTKNKNHKRFEIYAKHFFLTYPYKERLTKFDKKSIIDLFKEKAESVKARLKYIVVSFETGQKTTDSKDYEHLHVQVSFDRRIQVRRQEFFDLAGVHGHYKAIEKEKGNIARVREYCMKDGDYLEWKDIAEVSRLTESPGTLVKLVEYLIRLKPEERGKAIEGLSSASKALYLLNESRINRAIQIQIGNHNVQDNRYQLDQFSVPAKIKEWMETMMEKTALILTGRSGTGKTELAIAIFKKMVRNPLLVRDINQLKGLNHGHDGIIFDDISLKGLKRERIIHLIDVERASGVDIKHGCAIIPEKTPLVFTTNLSINEFLGAEAQIPEEFARRITVVVVDDDMRIKK